MRRAEHQSGVRAKTLLAGLGLAVLVVLLYTSYHQHHKLSNALHDAQNNHGGSLHDGAATAMSAMDWDAIWAAARAAGDKQEFLAAMGGDLREHVIGGGVIHAEDGRPSADAAACPPQRPCPACATPAPSPPSPPPCPTSTSSTSSTAATALTSLTDSHSGRAAWKRFLVDGAPPPLSKELAVAVAGGGAIIVTWSNYALWDFVQTWVFHARQAGLRNFIVGAMDAQIGEALVAADVPCFAMYSAGSNHSGVGADHLQWGGEAFHKMGRQKITLAQLFLGLGLDLLLVDVDVMLLGDVMEYFGRYPQADVLVTSDHLASTLEPGDDGLERPDKAGSPMNIGLMFFRHGPATVGFVDRWLAAINADPKYWDQNAFNDLVRTNWDPVFKVHPDQKRVFLGANSTLGVGVLPVASFSGGHTFYVQRLYEVQRVKPYAVHCTFQFGANAGKRNRLREATLFYDPPEYYTGDAYVSVELRRVPSATWADFSTRNASEMTAYHYKGLDMQLAAVWPGLSVAAAFNRSLILPKLACYCDKYWTDLDKCRVPGATQERIPFMCPMDHVLDPIFMTDPASKHLVRWREHSFLDNPRCPDWVKHSRVTFYSSPRAAARPVEKWVVQEGGLVVVLPANLTQGALREALAPYTSYKVWHLKDPESFFGGFDDKELGEAVQLRIEHLKPRPPPPPSPPPPANGTAAATSPSPASSTSSGAGAAAAAAGAGAGAARAGAGGAVKEADAGLLPGVYE